jgi:hypothetical protein
MPNCVTTYLVDDGLQVGLVLDVEADHGSIEIGQRERVGLEGGEVGRDIPSLQNGLIVVDLHRTSELLGVDQSLVDSVLLELRVSFFLSFLSSDIRRPTPRKIPADMRLHMLVSHV